MQWIPRELLGLNVFASGDEASWTEFLRSVVSRGLGGIQLVIPDAHQGLKEAVDNVPLLTSCQRCRTHFAENLLTRVPKSAKDFVAAPNRSIFADATADRVWAQHGCVIEQLTNRFPQAANLLSETGADFLAFTGFANSHWRRICSNNPRERLIREIRSPTDVDSVFSNRDAIIRLIESGLAEQNGE